MKFKLKIQMPDLSEDIWTYNNYDNEIISQRFGEINSKVLRKLIPIKPYNEDTPIYRKINDIEIFQINLGDKCNFHCKYCPQKESNLYSASPSDVIPFIEKLKVLKEKGFSPRHIRYWGGEPLVYWKTLAKLIPLVYELFGDIHYSLTTNGSLLTEEIIDFFKQYKVTINISHDGKCQYATEYKDKDILTNKTVVEAIKHSLKDGKKDTFFMNVMTKENPNINNTLNYFRELFDSSNIRIAPVCYKWNKNNKDISIDFTKEEKEEIAKGAYQAMTENAEYIEHTKNYNRFLLRVIHRESVDSVKQYCDMVDKGLITDLAGNTYSCVIRLSKIGTLETFESCPSYGNIHWSNRKKCKDCLLLQLCGGHCVRQKNGWEFEKSCENSYYPFHLGLFKAAFKQLFNVDIIEIENA